MKLIRNSGNERVIDELKKCLVGRDRLDIASPAFSLFAFGEVRELVYKLDKCRLVLPSSEAGDLALVGSISDRPFRSCIRPGLTVWPGWRPQTLRAVLPPELPPNTQQS